MYEDVTCTCDDCGCVFTADIPEIGAEDLPICPKCGSYEIGWSEFHGDDYDDGGEA